MQSSFIKDILLIQDPSISRFYKEILVICGYFIAPFFTVALILEYFGTMDFGGVVKRLLIIMIVLNSFYYMHTTASDTSLEFASYTLKKASPRNLFMKKWHERKVRTKLPSGWDYVWIGNSKDTLNDLFGTALFLLSKILFIVLKLIYSTVYHLNYAFSGYTALCYFFKWTEGALRGTFLSLAWCVLQPFVLVGVLCIVGNSFDDSALRGEVVGSGVDHMAWLFGVSLLIVATPVITYSLITGAGVQGAGSKLSELVIGTGLKTVSYGSMISGDLKSFSGGIGKVGAKSLFEPFKKEASGKLKDGMKVHGGGNRMKDSKMNSSINANRDQHLSTSGGDKNTYTQNVKTKDFRTDQTPQNSDKSNGNVTFTKVDGNPSISRNLKSHSITPDVKQASVNRSKVIPTKDISIPSSASQSNQSRSFTAKSSDKALSASSKIINSRLNTTRLTRAKRQNDRLPGL